jgi:ABC-type anion transport system duplicated permease subunit
MAQPLVQIAASVPATTLFPVVLFNIIARAMAVPSDLKEATEVVRIAG